MVKINIIDCNSSFFPCEIEEWCRKQITDNKNKKSIQTEKITDFWFKYFVNTSGPNPECRYFVKKGTSGEIYIAKDQFDETEKREYVIQTSSYNCDGEKIKKATVELLSNKELMTITNILDAAICEYSIVELRH